MADKSAAMVKFVFGLVILAPITLIAGILGLSWMWEYLAGCFFSFSYYCGQGELFKGIVFLFIAAGSVTGIQKLWANTK
jgi:hypothetical protein